MPVSKRDSRGRYAPLHQAQKLCTVCGKPFTPKPTKRLRQKTCSWRCRSQAIRRNTPRQVPAPLRAKVLQLRAAGHTLREISLLTGTSPAFVAKFTARHRIPRGAELFDVGRGVSLGSLEALADLLEMPAAELLDRVLAGERAAGVILKFRKVRACRE